jgi:hypothetical protein
MFKMRVAGFGSSIPQTCTGNAKIEEWLGLDRAGSKKGPVFFLGRLQTMIW